MIYFIQGMESGRIKIGFTAEDPASRLAELQTGSPERLHLLATTPGDRDTERRLHEEYASSKAHGEWFNPTPAVVRLVAGAPANIIAWLEEPSAEQIAETEARIAKWKAIVNSCDRCRGVTNVRHRCTVCRITIQGITSLTGEIY